MKEQIYDWTVRMGISLLRSVFPEFYAKDPLTPTDRYIEYPFVLSKLPKVQAKVLDVGCAGSMLPLLIQSLGHKVIGTDIRDYEGDVWFLKEDICHSTLDSNSVDIITCVSTIEHIGLEGRYGASSKSSDFSALTSMMRILKPFGLLLMTVPFGEKYEVTKFHRIYDKEKLDNLLLGYTYNCQIVPSPEAEYSLALITAMK